MAWPLILILAGLLLLLSNLGLIPWSAWALASHFWPLALVLIGLDILLSRTRVGPAVVLGIGVLMALGVGLATLHWRYPAPAMEMEQVVQGLDGLRQAEVELDSGIGELIVDALPSDSLSLMEGQFRHTLGAKVLKSFQASEGEGRLRLESGGSFPFLPLSGGRRSWDIRLTRRIPLDLKVETGVGEARLNLRELQVIRLDLDAGMGNVLVTFPSKAGLTTAEIDGGVGNLILEIPPQVEARIHVDRGLGSLSIDRERFPRSGEIYVSEGFSSAENKLELDVSVGVGDVTIR